MNQVIKTVIIALSALLASIQINANSPDANLIEKYNKASSLLEPLNFYGEQIYIYSPKSRGISANELSRELERSLDSIHALLVNGIEMQWRLISQSIRQISIKI